MAVTTRHPELDGAVASLRSMAFGPEPNVAVRELAAASLELVSWYSDMVRPGAVPGDRGPQMLALNLPALRQPPVDAVPRSVAQGLWVVPSIRGHLWRSSLGTVAEYDRLVLPGVEPSVKADLLPHEWSWSPGSSAQRTLVDSLAALVVAAARTLCRVRGVMGPRSEEAVRSMQGALREAPGLAARAQDAAKACVAYADDATRTAAGALRQELLSLPLGTTAELEPAPNSWPFAEMIRHGECVYLDRFPGVSAAVELGFCVRRQALCLHNLSAPGRPSVPQYEVFGRDWAAEVRSRLGTVQWHLSRARKAPKLWW